MDTSKLVMFQRLLHSSQQALLAGRQAAGAAGMLVWRRGTGLGASRPRRIGSSGVVAAASGRAFVLIFVFGSLGADARSIRLFVESVWCCRRIKVLSTL